MKSITIILEKEEAEVNVHEYERFEYEDQRLLDELIEWLKGEEKI